MSKKTKKTPKKPIVDLDKVMKKEEINYKKEETRYKKEDADLMKLNVLEKTLKLDKFESDKKDDLNLNKARVLLNITGSCIVDKGTTIGSETRWKSLWEEEELDALKIKLLSIINKF
jgi:hypothetical protein